MIRVRFYTEDPSRLFWEDGRAKLFDLLHRFFPKGCNVSTTDGIWEGIAEDSIVIEVIGNYSVNYCNSFADKVKETFKQESVLYTREIVEATLR